MLVNSVRRWAVRRKPWPGVVGFVARAQHVSASVSLHPVRYGRNTSRRRRDATSAGVASPAMKLPLWPRLADDWPDWKLDAVLAALFVLVAIPATAVIPVRGAHVRHPDALAYVGVAVAALGIAGHRRCSWPALGAAVVAAVVNSARSYPGGRCSCRRSSCSTRSQSQTRGSVRSPPECWPY